LGDSVLLGDICILYIANKNLVNNIQLVSNTERLLLAAVAPQPMRHKLLEVREEVLSQPSLLAMLLIVVLPSELRDKVDIIFQLFRHIFEQLECLLTELAPDCGGLLSVSFKHISRQHISLQVHVFD